MNTASTLRLTLGLLVNAGGLAAALHWAAGALH